MTVYVVAGKRRTLHKGVQGDAGVMSLEGCNLDDARSSEIFTDWNLAKSAAKRWCKRDFPVGPIE